MLNPAVPYSLKAIEYLVIADGCAVAFSLSEMVCSSYVQTKYCIFPINIVLLLH